MNDQFLDYIKHLSGADWTVGKYHTEFALYDTNVSHDALWTTPVRATTPSSE